MKIVLVTRVYPTHRPGGMPFVVQDRARGLMSLGHEVTVLTTKKAGDGENIVAVNYCPDGPTEVWSREFSTWCEQECKRINPDIIHSDSTDLSRPWWTSFSCKTACTLHGFAWGAFFTQWNLFYLGKIDAMASFDPVAFVRERKVLNSYKTVIGISRHEWAMLRGLFHIYNAKLVYNPICSSFFKSPIVAPPSSRKFLCAAISGTSNRMFNLAESAAKRANVELTVLQHTPRTSMWSAYDEISAVVLPTTYSQGYDLTVAEAHARGRPVIASGIGSYLMEENPGILTFPMGDEDCLAELLRSELPAVDVTTANKHRPEIHAQKWLEAIDGC